MDVFMGDPGTTASLTHEDHDDSFMDIATSDNLPEWDTSWTDGYVSPDLEWATNSQGSLEPIVGMTRNAAFADFSGHHHASYSVTDLPVDWDIFFEGPFHRREATKVADSGEHMLRPLLNISHEKGQQLGILREHFSMHSHGGTLERQPFKPTLDFAPPLKEEHCPVPSVVHQHISSMLNPITSSANMLSPTSNELQSGLSASQKDEVFFNKPAVSSPPIRQSKKLSMRRRTSERPPAKSFLNTRGCPRHLREQQIPGYRCFDQWNVSPTVTAPLKRRRMTTTQRDHRSRNLQWAECISSSLEDVNIFTQCLTIAGEVQVSETVPLCGDDQVLRDCMPLLRCLVEQNSWWSPNLSVIFDGPLRQHLALNPYLVLADDKLFFVMEKSFFSHEAKSVNVSSICYISKGPFTITEELAKHYEASGAAARLRGLKTLWRSWCAHIGFVAIQKALRRRTLQRLSRSHRIRLLVCLISLLKTVHELKSDLGNRWAFINPLTAKFLSPYQQRFESMRAHLVKMLSYYARYLASQSFSSESPIHNCFVGSNAGMSVSFSIFSALDKEIGRLLEDENRALSKEAYHAANFATLKIIFADTTPQYDMPGMRDPSVSAGHQRSQEDFTHLEYSHQVERLSIALAGCSLDDTAKEEPLPLYETLKYCDGKIAPACKILAPTSQDQRSNISTTYDAISNDQCLNSTTAQSMGAVEKVIPGILSWVKANAS
ncbi:hypothetical protein NA57DRAFT_78599 [Rhizodiscina lignyota]|uniref:Uncharacterized protein n=1 Tax=Rhizodiscina lignyota TaxID=1504668 RepID=A0A9P4ICQ3_9PEZI|nr:hypothetical protein NA57DRAFT_78599 [Rhizodiscina lignyota]